MLAKVIGIFKMVPIPSSDIQSFCNTLSLTNLLLPIEYGIIEDISLPGLGYKDCEFYFTSTLSLLLSQLAHLDEANCHIGEAI